MSQISFLHFCLLLNCLFHLDLCYGAILPPNFPKQWPFLKSLNPEEYIESEPMDGFNIHENDILIPKKRRLHPREVNPIRQWPARKIPYEIDPRAGFMSNETDMLMLAFKEFSDKSCVQFVPRQNERDYVFITTDPKRGCLSYIGWQGGKQEVYLLRPNCFYLKGTIIHELMHTIGFYHEHSRPDRDDHVQVVWDNIRPDKMSNFQIEQAGNMLGAPYDYLSVMHYSALTFSKDSDSKQYTMVPRDPLFSADRLGQRRGFSLVDLQQINTFYSCTANLNQNRGIFSSGNLDDFTPTAAQPDSEEASQIIGQIAQFSIREPRNEWPTPDVAVRNPSLISVELPVVVGGSMSVSSDALCNGAFFPDAVLNFLGYFYLFKDGSYWKFSYADTVFTREPNFPRAYSANFNADMPAQLDSVFSYLTYIYFVKGTTVWVAKSDNEIRGPVELSQLFPGLPDTPWDNVFARGSSITFIAGAFIWHYDVRTDTMTGPTRSYQSALISKGPIAELPDGRLAVFPRSNEPPGSQGEIYILDRFTEQALPGFPRSITDTFC